MDFYGGIVVFFLEGGGGERGGETFVVSMEVEC